MEYKIYGLRTNNTKRYFYVGCTKDVYNRFMTHLSCAKNNNPKPLYHRMRKILNSKDTVTYDILETCTAENKDLKEKYWIRKLIAERHNLTNRQGIKKNIKITFTIPEDIYNEFEKVMKDTGRSILTVSKHLVLKGIEDYKNIGYCVFYKYSVKENNKVTNQ